MKELVLSKESTLEGVIEGRDALRHCHFKSIVSREYAELHKLGHCCPTIGEGGFSVVGDIMGHSSLPLNWTSLKSSS